MILILISQINLLLCLVNDILDLKMIDEDRFVSRQELFDPTATFKFIISVFSQMAEMQDTKLMYEPINGQLPSQFIGDQVRLKQVLVNLTKNALKFSYKKPVTLQASYDETRQLLCVKVVDKGRGIRETDMNQLFKLFGKLSRTEAENVEGIGMGLTICKLIVDQCGGQISCHSDGENLGSTFTFSMKMQLIKVED